MKRLASCVPTRAEVNRGNSPMLLQVNSHHALLRLGPDRFSENIRSKSLLKRRCKGCRVFSLALRTNTIGLLARTKTKCGTDGFCCLRLFVAVGHSERLHIQAVLRCCSRHSDNGCTGSYGQTAEPQPLSKLSGRLPLG